MNQSRELLFTVNSQIQPSTPQPRWKCHQDPSLTHRVVHIHVINDREQILAQYRVATKEVMPSKWDTAVGGHQSPEESSITAAYRETKEEIGIKPDKVKQCFEYLWFSDIESEWVTTFSIKHDGPFKRQVEEIADLKFMDRSELNDKIRRFELTPNFQMELELLENHDIVNQLNVYPFHEILSCDKCPRLKTFRESISPRKAIQTDSYWNRPVPGFGDRLGRLLIIGLAPGAHGANRTGRPFTGDAAGEILYPALESIGLANRVEARNRGDGLILRDVFISNAVKCVPPDNQPSAYEVNTCRQYMIREIKSMPNLKAIFALGGKAFDSIIRILPPSKRKNVRFEHGKMYKMDDFPCVMGCYHPSRRNINTRVLSYDDFRNKLEQIYAFVSGMS